MAIFDNAEDMFEMESLIVNEDFVGSKETYNVRLGGPGGPAESKAMEYYTSGKHKENMLKARAVAVANVPIRKQKRIDKYMENPTLCKHCDTPLPYDKKRNKFCNSSCSATFNNTGRIVTEEHKQKRNPNSYTMFDDLSLIPF